MTNQEIFIVYRNHRGEVSERKILPRSFRFGVSIWHPEPQWLLEAYDITKAADRTFALKDILQWRAASLPERVFGRKSGEIA